MRNKFILLIALFSFASSAWAAVPTRDSIVVLLEATHSQRTLDEMFATIDGMMKQNMQAAAAGRPVTPEQQRKAELMSAKVAQIFREEMTWPKLEPLYVQIYQQTFTQEEVDGLIAFYRSPVGMAYVDKLPTLLRSTVAATQSLMGPMMKRLEGAAKEVAEETTAPK